MCGLVGFHGNFSRDALTKMGEKIVHRGPDDLGTFFNPQRGIGLLHTRLSIIDPSPAGHQPMFDNSGQVAIVFNGEIYNFRELRSELEGVGFSFRGHSDTEVLLSLYLHLGETMLSRLQGIFALAVWDSRTSSILLARDPLGVKPLYYAETEKGVVFASELKALLVNPEVNRDLDSYAILMHLTYMWCPSPHTIISGVKKSPPGHAMVLSDRRVQRHWKYYELPFDQSIEAFKIDDAVSAVKKALRTSVQRQMVADVPIGAFLSGGLDSSAVIALAKESNPDLRMQCFTISVDQAGKDGFAEDLPYANRVAQHLGVDLHTLHVGPEIITQLERMVYHLDEPLADPAPLYVFLISQLARDNGIKVLLSGVGGDDIFGGYRRHYALCQERYWSWLPSSGRHLLEKGAKLLSVNRPSLRRVRRAFEYASLEGDERLVSYFYWGQPDELSDLFSPETKAQLAHRQVAAPLLSALDSIPRGAAALNRMLFLEGKFFLPEHNLNYTDKMSMASGVEVRVPLLDLDLISLAARLPVNYKQRGSEGKWIFKKAMEGYLPLDVIYRPKTGFGAPLRSWLKYELSSYLRDVLSDQSIKGRGIFSSDSVQGLVNANASNKVDGTYSLFSILCIELWCRKFLDT